MRKSYNINQYLTKSLGVSGAKNYIIIDENHKAITLPPSLQPDDIHLPSRLCNTDETGWQD